MFINLDNFNTLDYLDLKELSAQLLVEITTKVIQKVIFYQIKVEDLDIFNKLYRLYVESNLTQVV